MKKKANFADAFLAVAMLAGCASVARAIDWQAAFYGEATDATIQYELRSSTPASTPPVLTQLAGPAITSGCRRTHTPTSSILRPTTNEQGWGECWEKPEPGSWGRVRCWRC